MRIGVDKLGQPFQPLVLNLGVVHARFHQERVFRRHLPEGDISSQVALGHRLDDLVFQRLETFIAGFIVLRTTLSRCRQAISHLANPLLALLRLDLGHDLLEQVGALQVIGGELRVGGRTDVVTAGRMGVERAELAQ